MKKIAIFTLVLTSFVSSATFATGRQIVDGDDFCGSHKLPKKLEKLIGAKTSGAQGSAVKFESIDEVYSFLADRNWTGYFYSQIFESGLVTYSFLNSFSETKPNRFGLDLSVTRDLSAVKVRAKSSCNRSSVSSDLTQAARSEESYLKQNKSFPLSQISVFGMDASSVVRGEFNLSYANSGSSVVSYRSTFNLFGAYSYKFSDQKIVDRLYFERHLLLDNRKYTIKYFLFSDR